MPQWGAHFLDTVHFIMDAGFPESCMCMGGVFTWKDEDKFTAPDNVTATWAYPEGFILTSSNSLGNGSGNGRAFYGTKGTLTLDNWNAPTYSAEGGPKRDGGTSSASAASRQSHSATCSRLAPFRRSVSQDAAAMKYGHP